MKAAPGFLALAAIAGALIGATRWLTADQIIANQAAREQAVIQDILGTTAFANDDALSRLCRTSVRGYAGNIELLVLPAAQVKPSTQPLVQSAGERGLAPRRKITAVRVLQHRETPGIGDFITTDNSPWIHGFAGLTQQQTPRDTIGDWNDQLDAVSGATITRRAMIKGVATACEFND